MKNIVIMGAGPAGLTAGIELQSKCPGCRITIIEKSEAVGGISRTVVWKGNRFDIGGHRYFTRNQAVLQWWDSILPIRNDNGTSPFPDGGAYMMTRPRSSHIYFNSQFVSYPMKIDRHLLKAVGPLRSMKVLLSYLHTQFNKRDVQSLEDYYVNQFGYELYSIFFKGYTKKVCGVAPNLISPDWGTQRVKGLSIPELLKSMLGRRCYSGSSIEATMTDTFLFPPGGSGQLWEAAAEQFRQAGGEIIFNCEPTKISVIGKKVVGLDYQQCGAELHLPVDTLLSTIPLAQLFQLLPYSPPNSVLSVVMDLHYRDFILVGLMLDKRKLKTVSKTEALFMTDSWVYIQNEDLRMSRIQIFNNWSPSMLVDPINFLSLGVEFCCDKDDDFWKLSDESIVRLCLSELQQLGLFSNMAIDDACVIRQEKAYPCYHGAYNQLDSLHDYLRNSFENLHCLGRNGEHRYLNIDQVMEHAFDVVSEITN